MTAGNYGRHCELCVCVSENKTWALMSVSRVCVQPEGLELFVFTDPEGSLTLVKHSTN